MPALLPRGARALRTGDDSGGRGYLIWQFGRSLAVAAFGAALAPTLFWALSSFQGLRVFCWLWRWLSRLSPTSAALIFKSFLGK